MLNPEEETYLDKRQQTRMRPLTRRLDTALLALSRGNDYPEHLLLGGRYVHQPRTHQFIGSSLREQAIIHSPIFREVNKPLSNRSYHSYRSNPALYTNAFAASQGQRMGTVHDLFEANDPSTIASMMTRGETLFQTHMNLEGFSGHSKMLKAFTGDVWNEHSTVNPLKAALFGAAFFGSIGGAQAQDKLTQFSDDYTRAVHQTQQNKSGGITYLNPQDAPSTTFFNREKVSIATSPENLHDIIWSNANRNNSVIEVAMHGGGGRGIFGSEHNTNHWWGMSLNRFKSDLPPSTQSIALAMCNSPMAIHNPEISVLEAQKAIKEMHFDGVGKDTTIYNLNETLYFKGTRLERTLKTPHAQKDIFTVAVNRPGLILHSPNVDLATKEDLIFMGGNPGVDFSDKGLSTRSKIEIYPTAQQQENAFKKIANLETTSSNVIRQEAASSIKGIHPINMLPLEEGLLGGGVLSLLGFGLKKRRKKGYTSATPEISLPTVSSPTSTIASKIANTPITSVSVESTISKKPSALEIIPQRSKFAPYQPIPRRILSERSAPVETVASQITNAEATTQAQKILEQTPAVKIAKPIRTLADNAKYAERELIRLYRPKDIQKAYNLRKMTPAVAPTFARYTHAFDASNVTSIADSGEELDKTLSAIMKKHAFLDSQLNHMQNKLERYRRMTSQENLPANIEKTYSKTKSYSIPRKQAEFISTTTIEPASVKEILTDILPPKLKTAAVESTEAAAKATSKLTKTHIGIIGGVIAAGTAAAFLMSGHHKQQPRAEVHSTEDAPRGVHTSHVNLNLHDSPFDTNTLDKAAAASL